ncbi:MAG: hypothetical protein JXB32_09325 [Deltaproteobacteria bacterium]|nr:hypothetical protein [Deltaproteobacteria bacterium]
MRGYWLVFVLLVVAAGSVACGGDDSNPADTGETTETTEGGADADADDGGPGCPAMPPPDNPCTSPGQVCEYPIPGCDTMYCECIDDSWHCTGGHYCDAVTEAETDGTDVFPDVPADVEPDTLLPDVPVDVPVDVPTDTASYPACAARGGTCTEYRWVICPAGTEPAPTEAHEDCPGGGWCCVPAPTSTCSSSGYANCVEGERCTECWAAPDDTTLTCEAGRVCCLDICD